jgi:hypothetical protein
MPGRVSCTRRLFLSLAAASLVLGACHGRAQDDAKWTRGAAGTPSRFAGRADPIAVTLLDAYSGEPIVDQEVRATRDTGVRCAVAPCPSTTEDWRGRSDSRGRVAIPRAKLFRQTALTVSAYAEQMVETARETTASLLLDLVPNGMNQGTRPLQLLDATTGAPLALVVVGVGNGRRSTELVTSPVGYLFIDEDYIYSADAAVATLSPQGYRAERVDFMELDGTTLRVRRLANGARGQIPAKGSSSGRPWD